MGFRVRVFSFLVLGGSVPGSEYRLIVSRAWSYGFGAFQAKVKSLEFKVLIIQQFGVLG